MRVIVVGASLFGVATIRQLLKAGHEVVLIDRDRERLDALSDDLECGLIHGDGTLPSILREAAGERTDILMMLTNHEEANILGAAVGRAIGFERVIIQIIRAQLLPITEELGFQEIVTPHETVARSIVASLDGGGAPSHEHTLSNELRSVVQEVGPRLDGARLGDLDLPEGARPVARIRDEAEALTEPDMRLREGDRLLFAVKREEATSLAETFERPEA